MVRRIIIICISFFISTALSAQSIRSNAADRIDTTQYISTTQQDTIFIFFGPDNYGAEVFGSLQAVPPGQAEGWSFYWEKYSRDSMKFCACFRDNFSGDTNASTLTGLRSGGYRVQMIKDSDTVYKTAWVYQDELFVDIEKLSSDCNGLELQGLVDLDSLIYYDPDSTIKEFLLLENEIDTFIWRSEPSYDKVNPEYLYQGIFPPYEDTDFFLTASNKFGNSYNPDAVYHYRAIAVKADFDFTPKEEDAPATISFTNNSKGPVFNHEWYYLGPVDTVMFSEDENPLDYVFEKPGTYYLKLVIDNPACADSITHIDSLFVNESLLDSALTNVFTPNGDGINDHFLLRGESLKKIDITIFNRAGKMVYSYEGDFESWEGWDGHIKNSNREAPAGLYVYVVHAIGWDNKIYNNRNILYLFRDRNGFF